MPCYNRGPRSWPRSSPSQATTVEELNELMRVMMKSGLERMLDSEMDVHLGRRSVAAAATLPAPAKQRSPNRRNGRSRKRVQGDLGQVTLSTPRDRNGTFEPQLIAKHQRRLAGFDEKILALYAKGMTTRDIQDIVKDLYGVEVSPTLVSEITADLDAEVTAWRTRRLWAVWPIVYLDGIVVHVRGENGRVSQHTMYVAIGVNLQGRKELLGLWLAETEGAKFWLCCLTDLKNRGVSDIFVVCVDGLSGFPEAIRTAFPQTKVQLCIVHLVRAALKYVTEDSKSWPRPQEDLPVGDGARSGRGAERFAQVGCEVSDDHQAVACEVDGHHHAVRVPAADPQGDLHDQRDRVCQQRDSEVHPQPQAVPECGVGVEVGVHGDSRGVEEVDDADRGLEGGVEPLRHRVRGPHARANQFVTSLLA